MLQRINRAVGITAAQTRRARTNRIRSGMRARARAAAGS